MTERESVSIKIDRLKTLKEMSKAREATWDNTVAAQREEKLRLRQERLDRLEEARQKIDREEENLAAQVRHDQIKRAADLMENGMDLMKQLKSRMLLSDVLEERKYQIEVKNHIKGVVLKQKNRDHQQVLRNEEVMRQREVKEEEERKKKALYIASVQKDQLKEMRERQLVNLAQHKMEGELLLAKAKHDIALEEEKILESKRRGRENAMEMTRANDDLKVLQGQWAVQELEAERKRKSDQAKKEKMAHDRKAHELLQMKRKQDEQQKMIDLAVYHLKTLKNTEDTRLQNQINDKLAADDAKMQAEIQKREKLMIAIKRSRETQIANRNALKEEKMIQDKDFAEQWRVRQKALEEEERGEKAKVREDNKRYERYLKKSIMKIREMKEREKRERLSVVSTVKSDRATFEAHVRKTIDEYAAEGKNIIPLARSLVPDDELKAAI